MAIGGRILLESGSPDGYLLEDGSGVYLLDTNAEIVANINTSVTALGSGVYRITKNTGANGYNADAVSTVGFTGDFVVEVSRPAIGNNFDQSAVGVSADAASFSTLGLDYSIVWDQASGRWYIYEGGSYVLINYLESGGKAYIWRTGTTLGYGTGASLATAQASPARTVNGVTARLYFDSSLYFNGDAADASFSGEDAGGAILQPDLFVNSSSFHTPAVAASKTLTPALLIDTDAFLSPTVAPGAVTWAPALFADADAFYTQVLAASYQLSPALFSDPDTFHAPTVAGLNTLTPSLFADGDSFYSPTVTQPVAGVTLFPGLLINTSTFHGPTISSLLTLLPALYVDPDTILSPAASPGPVTLQPALHADQDVFYAHQVLSTGGASGGSGGPRVTAFFYRG
jgi:hypothetical protein